MKQEILKKYKLNKEDNLLCAYVLDKHDMCENKNFQTNTYFLDLRQQGIVKNISKDFSVKHCFYGGFDDAERKIIYFIPDYMDEAETDELCVLEVTHSGHKELSHRDYLGSVLSLGLKRESIGDIIVSPSKAQIITTEKIADFLKNNYAKAGHINLSCDIKPISELELAEKKVKLITDTVMSLRLDSVVASAFSISRTLAVKNITAGKVFLNDAEVLKVDKQIEEGNKIILRGKGKAILKSVSGTSKKGRIWIEIERYI